MEGGMSFLAESGSGHTVLMDGPPEAGGKNSGPRPMEMVLMGTGGCAAFDVVMILKKSRQDISDCVVEIEAERAAQEPKVFTRIHFHFILSGKKLNSAQVETGNQAFCGKILLGLNNAGKNGGIDTRL